IDTPPTTIYTLSLHDALPIFELIKALGTYSLNVVLALAVMVFVIYPSILKLFTKMRFPTFLRGILPAQVLAFSTSSSAATLPVRSEEHTSELQSRENLVCRLL